MCKTVTQKVKGSGKRWDLANAGRECWRCSIWNKSSVAEILAKSFSNSRLALPK
ncbi:MAG: hypothetical protein N2112_00160 [Gemmataceae bacterium]|nr:hypothetical protein [Gemmataceae bacterium]